MVKDTTRKVVQPDWEGREYYSEESGIYDMGSDESAKNLIKKLHNQICALKK